MENLSIFVNGKWVDSSSKNVIEVENPANKTIFGKVTAANEEDVNLAVKAAKDAFVDWKNTPIDKRIEYINKMIEYFEKNVDEIADIVVQELGSIRKITKQVHVIDYIEDAKNYVRLTKGKEMIEDNGEYKVYHEPVGVVACLTPWNFPFGQIEKKVIPALLMGNTIVLKPSQKTPFSSFYYARAAKYANLPAGVFNLITGRGAEVGNVLASHKDVDMVSFTGSTKGGIEVSKLALDSVKRLALELGGKSASILLEGYDYEKAIKKTLSAVYPNAGQACSSKTRLLAPRKDREKIEEIVIKVTKEYKHGNPDNPENDYGPVQSKDAFDKVMRYIELGKKESNLLYEGEWIEDDGYYIPPVVFTDVDNNSKIAQEEIFGPVECIIFYDTVEEAIEIANDSKYGLHGMVFGPDDEALRVAREIRTGQLQVNDGSRGHFAPFGGYKQSGIGREGGKYGLDEYTEIKTIFN